jgi:hypothetical protein
MQCRQQCWIISSSLHKGLDNLIGLCLADSANSHDIIQNGDWMFKNFWGNLWCPLRNWCLRLDTIVEEDAFSGNIGLCTDTNSARTPPLKISHDISGTFIPKMWSSKAEKCLSPFPQRQVSWRSMPPFSDPGVSPINTPSKDRPSFIIIEIIKNLFNPLALKTKS